MKAINYILLSALVIIGAISCTEKGATGPTGPAGSTGSQGASATYTLDTVTISPAQWQGSATLLSVSFPEPYIDNPQSSLIEVYISFTDNSKSFWFQLPISGIFASGDQMYFSYDPYNIYLWYVPNSSTPSTNIYVRTIIIPQP